MRKYQDIPSILISDHRPVLAEFQVMVLRADVEKERELYQDQNGLLDYMEKQIAPEVEVTGQFMDLGRIAAMTRLTRTLRITNIGLTVACWEFIQNPLTHVISKPWLHFHPLQGVLSPGEVTNYFAVFMVCILLFLLSF